MLMCMMTMRGVTLVRRPVQQRPAKKAPVALHTTIGTHEQDWKKRKLNQSPAFGTADRSTPAPRAMNTHKNILFRKEHEQRK